ncbi:MAG TPA: phosphatase PAP2 family protein [Gammaproteobacteria bacterium]
MKTFFDALFRGAAAAALSLACGAVHADSETAGDVLRVALPAAAFAVTVRQDDREGRRQFYRSFAANVGATLLLKSVVDDERPDGSDDDAFPSGHASMAFQAAGFLHRRYGARKAWPAYVLAGFVGWSRVDADEHDEADVVAGAALGVASAFLLTDRIGDGRVTVTAAPTDGGFRVTIAGNWGQGNWGQSPK